MSWCRTTAQGVVLTVRVTPRAAKNAVAGQLGDALRIRLQAPPVEGRANAALIRFLADHVNVPRSAVRLLAGESGRNKRLLIVGLSEADVRARLGV